MKFILWLSLLCVLPLSQSTAATVGLVSVADTAISEDNALSMTPDTMATGRLNDLLANSDGNLCRSLVRFDLSSVPTNAVVQSATVNFTILKSVWSTDDSHHLHGLTAPWNESTASWNNSGLGPWSGGAFDSEADATVTFPGPVTLPVSATFASTPELVARVQSWIVNAAGNHGWLLRNGDEGTIGTARRIGTRESTVSTARPQLTVTYTTPSQILLENPRRAAGKFVFNFQAAAGQSHTVRYKTALQPGAWTTLTNFHASGSPAFLTVEDTLTTSNRFYQVVSP